MPWFKLLSLTITLFNRVVKHLNDRKLLKAGEAQAIAQMLEQSQNEIYRGLIARNDADKLRESEDPFAE